MKSCRRYAATPGMKVADRHRRLRAMTAPNRPERVSTDVAINTLLTSENYRPKIVDPGAKRVLMTDFRKSLQAQDLTTPPNCGGFGRIRHFRRQTSAEWP